MKKKYILGLLLLAGVSAAVFAQSDDDFFGGDDDEFFFGSADDDFFFDDGIEELTDVTASTDLSKGVLFEDGSIKIGGSFTTSLGTSTILYQDTEDSFWDNLENITLSPTVSSYLTLDARPTQDLRMYTKFGLSYPFTNSFVRNWFSLKEMFTDFSLADRLFFRFGLHTVSWGAGYFFSPVSDMLNTSSIDPEDVSAQVDGSLNLRTQITFPGTQNCLWLYVVPSTDFNNALTTEAYLKETALAGKADLVFGNWEIGLGTFYKYQHAPKTMITATGSIKKAGIFGEAVYQYGSEQEWNDKPDNIGDKTKIIQFTAGMNYIWKDPGIILAAQYYYDGNDQDFLHKYVTHGHNIAVLTNFSKLFGSSDFNLSVFGMVNFGKKELDEEFNTDWDGTIPDEIADLLPEDSRDDILDYIKEQYGGESIDVPSLINTATFSVMLNYKPVDSITIGMGPYITFAAWDKPPVVSFKLNVTLGGGKF